MIHVIKILFKLIITLLFWSPISILSLILSLIYWDMEWNNITDKILEKIWNIKL